MSIWCGLSPDIFQLILARGIQGAGAALLIPCSLAIIGATFDEAERGKAIGTWAGFSAIAGAAGPLLGGWIVDHFTWRWIFLINPVLALPAIWIALNKVPESRDTQAKGGLDWRGSLLALASLGSLAFGLMSAPVFGWSSPAVVGALLIGAVAARGIHLGGSAQSGADAAARAISIPHLQRRQSIDAAALRGARGRILFSALRAHPGGGIFGGPCRRGLSAVHADHGDAVALGRRIARSLRRQRAADHWPRYRCARASRFWLGPLAADRTGPFLCR